MKLTNEQKWAEVDRILDEINLRKEKGITHCFTKLEEYVNQHFNKLK